MNTLHSLISLFLFSCFLPLLLSPLLQLQHHLYYAPNFTFSSKFKLWDPNTDCCSWEGVTCDAYGHVIGLDLSYKNLSGSFHSIFNLHRLQRLNLAGNNFNTTLFSYGFDKLQNLTHLNLSSSCFHVEISHLTRLVSLDLSNQDYCYLRYYTIIDPYNYKPNFKTLIKNLRFLTELYLDSSLLLSSSNFSGKLPQSIGNLKFLTYLELSYCNFFGPIPSSIANLSSLVNLDLAGNKLSGSIHSSLFTLPSLKSLSLSENQLVGKIDEFPNASSSLIQELYIGNNYLTGPIAKSILQLPRLEGLYIRGNSFSSTKLDMFVQLNNLRTLSLKNISLLSLRSCNLTEFLEFIKTQDKLVELYLSSNHIHGVVPNWLWKSSLSRVNLSFNVIDFPKQLPLSDLNFSFPMLKRLYLGSCNISSFPELLNSQENLEYLELSNNKISGAIPNWVSTSSQGSFTFDASYNNLSGPIPNWLCNMSQLSVCYAFYNNFNGPIPNCLCNMSQLRGFDASYNNLSGSIPNCLDNMSQLDSFDFSSELSIDFLQLRILDIGSNHFSGDVSIEFFLKAMMHLTNDDKAKLVLTILTCLDLSNNNEDSWLYAMSTWKIALIGYANGLVVGLFIGYTVLNELGNKWVEKFRKCGKRNRRRCR
ncbi:hypothetical protein GOBAR_AA14811 [Gossypium barbadense]|uniref:Leucine-rich repeat-containing N-terminal plant-type domain-containing protein n=1 Tax=Gossypium barbadense TaxID=3634 RepID=A0A2P5XR44_GOSBA|nr:hypothetical protein GOBAR_AA14811 [Gossypium barbadense]